MGVVGKLTLVCNAPGDWRHHDDIPTPHLVSTCHGRSRKFGAAHVDVRRLEMVNACVSATLMSGASQRAVFGGSGEWNVEALRKVSLHIELKEA